MQVQFLYDIKKKKQLEAKENISCIKNELKNKIQNNFEQMQELKENPFYHYIK